MPPASGVEFLLVLLQNLIGGDSLARSAREIVQIAKELAHGGARVL
jgi:hypothetical protein